MFHFRHRNRCMGMLMLAFMSLVSHAAEIEPQPMDICMAVAKQQLGKFRPAAAALESRCECVRSRRKGDMPTTASAWKITGDTSAALTLVECSQSDIISFYSGETLKSEMAVLEKTGAATQEREIQSVEDFSACVGESFYNEVRRQVASSNDPKASMNQARVMNTIENVYRQCDAATAPNQRSLNMCIAAAKDILEVFSLDAKTLQKKCACVRSKLNGKLPVNISGWENDGRNSASLGLVECAQSEVTAFFDGAAVTSASARLGKNGFTPQALKRYGACVGDGAYKQMHRMVASGDEKIAPADSSESLDLYAQCEAAAR